MTRGKIAILTFSLVLSATSTHAAIFQSTASLQGQQYANEASPGTRVVLNLSLVTTEDGENQPPLPSREIHFLSFYESGPGGDYSLDVDKTVQRFSLLGNGHVWIGRTHPLFEATEGTSATHVDAIGANWVQNQSDALNPRVAGWIGFGGHLGSATHGFSMTTAVSPVFLPSFGPRVQLSETSAALGSRFSRLPPQFVEQGNAVLPLRYRLHVGDIRSVVLQPQIFVSAGYAYSSMRVDFMDWTAPNPSPDVDTDYALVTHTSGKPSEDSEDVMIDAHPKFRRQHFTGVRYEAAGIPGKPLATATYEWLRKEITASLQTTPVEYLSLGALNRWAVTSPSAAASFSPSYADKLLWAEIGGAFYYERLKPSFRVEQHLSRVNIGRMIRPKIVYTASRNLDVFAFAQVMTGKDRSYFGEWRSLGSAAMGVNWEW